MFFNVVSAKDIFNVLFKVSYGKTVVFIIIILFFIAFLCFKGYVRKEKDKKTGKLRTIYRINKVTGKKEPDRIRYNILGLFFTLSAITLIAANYSVPQTPYTDYDSEVLLGNSSMELSAINYNRFNYLGDHFCIAKRSVQDTPSLWDIDNKNIDDNRVYWQLNPIEPIWEVSVIELEYWTVFHIEFYFPRNGIDPIGAKHEHDWEFCEFYYYKNETVPRLVAFPIFTNLVEHPRILEEWNNLPEIIDRKALLLDPQTNAFHENYKQVPVPSSNFRLTFISPQASEIFNYLTQFEKIQVYTSSILFIILFTYCATISGFRNRYLLILLIFVIIALYPVLTLQYDYVVNPSFRVWENGQHFDDSYWYDSRSGRDYISDYGGLPHDRGRWTKPAFESQLGS